MSPPSVIGLNLLEFGELFIWGLAYEDFLILSILPIRVKVRVVFIFVFLNYAM